ncbi:MarR family winged helix-turn-helix transcriptional regulator [Microbacterium dextranolyticum]|uniref:Transcriptional regulator n=1 Tax=Microbacterium dextranolyticum TaxID=36806 RepID=A0A9W6M4W0_9MICO|nr:MarR family transcriptional regulator [Microbacterium dextranolyticum]MBM7461634.1 DNA-binding MarR family transcriptional regulator [Microbacterium dextranolyticum]GLJ94724.1 transcriptional regulator [Microbacterium dextranolyticum]
MRDHVDRVQEQWRRERPDLDPSPQGVIGRLYRLVHALSDEILAVYARFGLSEAEFDLLAALRREGAPYELAAGELADHTMVTTGGLTKRVDRLIDRGLVVRGESPGDGRRRLIRLTDEGRRLIDEAVTAHLENEHRLIALIDPTDADALREASRRWLAAL